MHATAHVGHARGVRTGRTSPVERSVVRAYVLRALFWAQSCQLHPLDKGYDRLSALPRPSPQTCLDGQTVPIERGARCARESRLGRQSPWRGARDSPVTHRRSIRSAKLEIPTRTVPLRLVRGRHREADLSSGAAVEHPELSDAIRRIAGRSRSY